VPAAGAVQDTVDTRERGWIGISLGVVEVPPAEARRDPVRFLVAGVYPNSPADLADIVPGDWFVSVDGNPLSTYETWLRFTSDLQPGQSVLLVVGRNGDRNEVTVVADPAPAFVASNPLDHLERTMARFDSIVDAFLGYSPTAVPWPWHTPGIMFPEGFEVESPPSAGGGGPELTIELESLVEGRLSVLTPRLFDGPSVLVLGGVLVRDLTTELGRDYFGVERGILVEDVLPMSPGLQAGFRPGDVIVSVEDKVFEGVTGLLGLLDELDTPIELTVVRRKKSVKLVYPRPQG